MLPLPRHVAIIMDGNGRWAKERRHARTAGHIRGARRAQEIVTAADDLGVKYLTLFGFSSENWSRPSTEVSLLMRLLSKYLSEQAEELHARGARVRVFGDRSGFPKSIVRQLDHLIATTQNNTGLQLNFAFNYGSRQEILMAVRAVAREVSEGHLRGDEINEESFSKLLYSRDVPDPDLIIRTSGEQRISNFLLWQCAYSEFYFTPVMWPDFTAEEFSRALLAYQQRDRRFGAVETQKSTPPTLTTLQEAGHGI